MLKASRETGVAAGYVTNSPSEAEERAAEGFRPGLPRPRHHRHDRGFQADEALLRRAGPVPRREGVAIGLCGLPPSLCD